jgi:hypothetical protein
MGFASATQTLGTFKQGESINLIQTCSNCTYVNISTIQAPNSTIILNNKQMTKTGTQFNYTLSSQTLLGNYIVCGFGDLDGVITSWCYDFEITPTGNTQNTSQSIISFGLIFIMALFGLSFTGLGIWLFGKQNLWFYGVLIGLLGFVLIAYTLSSSVAYSRDLAYYSSTGAIQEKAFVTFINVVKYILLFSLPMFIWLAYESLKKRKSEWSLSDGWDEDKY